MTDAEIGQKIWEFKRVGTRLAYRFTRSMDSAEDMFQETARRAWENRHQFAGQSQFSAWMTRILRNACIEQIRKAKVRPNTVGDDSLPVAADRTEPVDLSIARRQLAEIALKYAKTLPKSQKLAIYATYDDTYDSHNMALKIGKFRAVRAARDVLEKHGCTEAF
jgi:RNA polymerase sigma-70 factor (ECF subfamily)